jgi:histidinol-phosphatase (PHP family)
MYTNHHAHTRFSDGLGTPEEYVQRAIARDMSGYGFSDHAPIPIAGIGSMEMNELTDYVAETERLRTTYADRIALYRSLEVDYIPGVMNVNSDHILAADLDYTVGAVHYVDYLPEGRPWSFQQPNPTFERGIATIFGGDVRAMVERYYALVREMVETHPPDVVAHLDRIKRRNLNGSYWDEHAGWYVEAVEQTLAAIAAAGVILEVNTRGIYLEHTVDPYPSFWIVERARERGIPLQVNSDAHRSEHIVGAFDRVYARLREMGVEETRVFDGKAFVPFALNSLQ